MQRRDWRLRIDDILKAIHRIATYTQNMEYADFIEDQRTVDAVVRNFAIIGEAAAHVPQEVCLTFSSIPWADMKAMRNFVVHEYFGVSERILWDTIQDEIPDLQVELCKMKDASYSFWEVDPDSSLSGRG